MQPITYKELSRVFKLNLKTRIIIFPYPLDSLSAVLLYLKTMGGKGGNHFGKRLPSRLPHIAIFSRLNEEREKEKISGYCLNTTIWIKAIAFMFGIEYGIIRKCQQKIKKEVLQTWITFEIYFGNWIFPL